MYTHIYSSCFSLFQSEILVVYYIKKIDTKLILIIRGETKRFMCFPYIQKSKRNSEPILAADGGVMCIY